MDNLPSIIIDNGSGILKAGFAGCNQPSVIFPSIIGHRQLKINTSQANLKEKYIGYDALTSKPQSLTLRYPVERGIVTNWDDMEMIWHHTFYNELQIAPEEHSILLTEVPLNPIGNRQMSSQILFEQFHVPAMCVAIDSVLAFFASGRAEGIVLECGDGVSYTMPIYQSNIMSHEIQRLDLAGRDLTCYMTKLLAQRGYSFVTTGEQEIVRDIKEKLIYAALDFDKEILNKNEKYYELPDGQKLRLDDECFRCTEALFQPGLIGENDVGIAHLLYNTINNCDIHIQDRLYRHIYLSGGTTMIPGLPDRLQKEMKQFSSSTSRIRFLVQPDRQHAVWIGGSILASFPTFQKAYISKLDYNEYGPSIIHRTCFL